jgi:hypothetical protein
MSNTQVQIKRSTTTVVPPNGSLAAGELAYSYLSDKLFISTSDGSGVIAIGGKTIVDTQNAVYTLANAAFDAANAASGGSVIDAYNQANASYVVANAAYDKANSANVLAYNTGIGANAYASSVGVSANVYAAAVGVAANLYADGVGTSANAYASSVGVSANAYSRTFANTVGTAANSYADTVGTSANVYASSVGDSANAYSRVFANTVGTSANAYADTVGTNANNYANGTFVKLTAPTQTITGNLAITGSLSVAGNTYVIDSEVLRISDPLIYLAGNNYVSDAVDIGFVANYVNATSQNVHTGFFRDYTTKEYYVFHEYSAEPEPNHIDTTGNNFTIAVLNADLRTSNLNLGGANAIVWIKAAYDQANAAPGIANSYASAVGVAANAFATSIGASSNAWANAVGVNANTYASSVGLSANSYADAVGVAANTYASAVGTSANAYSRVFANTVGTAANTYASAVGVAANTYASSVGVSANAYADVVGAAANTNAANASYLSTGTVPSGRLSGSYTSITGVGTLTAGTWNADVITVPYGGTGITSVTTNGILYGNNTGALKVTAAGTEGQVLQASATGVPLFAHIDGGTF